jgi:hypothetical protein
MKPELKHHHYKLIINRLHQKINPLNDKRMHGMARKSNF